jgi:hypothetical protein
MSEPLMLLPASALRATTTPKRGHADRPGTGPDGETCGSCKFLVKKQMAKAYTKCELTKKTWTGGGGSDIRHKDPACSFWFAKGK